MKKIIGIGIFAFISFSLTTHAMTVGDVLQQHNIFKTAPGVLGASTVTNIPSSSFSEEQNIVILQGLKYAKKSNQIIVSNLKVGTIGSEEVKVLQLFLIAKGYLSSDPTGYYGPKTKAAVKKFQTDNGIVSDGSIVGPATRAAITQWIASATK